MILGWMSKSELAIIRYWAKNIPQNGVVVELGSFMGKSAVCWATHCHPSVKIYCVDKFEEEYTPKNLISSIADPTNPDIPHNNITYNVYKSFLENTKQYKNIIPLRGTLPKIEYLGDYVDLLFVDLSHKNPVDRESIAFFEPYMKNNSIICGHDYCVEFPDVKENAHALANAYQTSLNIIPNTSLWLVKIKK